MPGAYGAADPLLLLFAALAFEAYLGGLGWLARLRARLRRPYLRLAVWLRRRLDRQRRGARALLVRGLAVALLLTALAALAGWLLALFTRFYPFAWAVELFVLVSFLQQRSIWRDVAMVRAALAAGSPLQAGNPLAHLAAGEIEPRALERLRPAQLVAATLTAQARRFADSLVAPVFWYVLLGLPGLFVQQALRLLASLYGGAGAATAAPFAQPAGLLDRAVGWLPLRLAALLLVVAALFVPEARPGAALRGLPRARDWPVAALGGALGFHEGAPADTRALARALALHGVACLVHVGVLALLLAARQWLR